MNIKKRTQSPNGVSSRSRRLARGGALLDAAGEGVHLSRENRLEVLDAFVGVKPPGANRAAPLYTRHTCHSN